MTKLTDLTKNVNSLVNKSKVSEGGFNYICTLDDYQCQGGKAIIEYIKEKHTAKFDELKEGFEDDKEFESQLKKLVRNAPFSDKNADAIKEKAKEKEQEAVQELEEEEGDYHLSKNLPMTLEYMKMLDERITKIPNYGSLVGRIARLLGVVLEKQQDDKIFDVKKEVYVEDVKGVFSYLEAEHQQFLDNLCTMFPPAKKRMNQFIEKAINNFDLKVPTWKLVEKLQKIESDKVAAEKKKEMDEKLAKAKAAREEMNKRRKEEAEKRAAQRKEDEEKRQALKRKKEEEAKLNEFKTMKISPNVDKADEILKLKKEICRIEKALEGKFMKGNNKDKLKEKLAENKEKLETLLREIKEKRVNKRLETCLENLSPKQLRKLSMEYFNNIDNLGAVSWTQMCQSVKIEDDFEFLTDFLGCLYEMAGIHQKDKKGFKVGHVLVTSKQSQSILDCGIRSIRDNIQSSFRIPDTWAIEKPEGELGADWSSTTDSWLLVGAGKFGKNLLKIIQDNKDLSATCLDSNGAVKDAVRKRFALLINVYINRGKPSTEFGDSLYSVDIDDGEEIIEEVLEAKDVKKTGVEEKKDDEIEEITLLDDEDDKENKENGAVEEKEVDEVLGEMNDKLVDEDIDDKLLDEAD